MIRLPEEIVRLLDGASRRVRMILVLRGLAASLATFLAATLAAMAADAFFVIFDDRVRGLIALAIWGLTALALALTVARPFLRPVSRRKAARALDERHPENEERLSTLADLASAGADPAATVSASLFARLAREGVICANRIDLTRTFTARTIRRRLYALGAVALLALVSFAVFPNVAGLLFVRAAFPWVDVGNLYADSLEVTPGSVVVLKGATVEIRARKLKDLPGDLMIRISRREGRGWGREFAEPLAPAGYRTVADLDEREWRYRISCGPAVSRYHTVRVCEMPRARSFTARLDYPAYARRAPLVLTNESVGAIQALAGTRVTFRLEIDEPGTTGEIALRGKDRVLVSDDGTLVAEMVSNRVAAWSMQMTNADGFKSPARGGSFTSVPDQPPVFAVESPKAALRLPPHAKLPIDYTAGDDVGLVTLETRFSTNACPFAALAREPFEGHPAFVRGKKEIDLSRLDLAGVREVRFVFVVSDGFPSDRGGPHSVTSSPVTVNFDSGARNWNEQSLEARTQAAVESIREADRRLDAAENRAREAKHEADRNRGRVTEGAERKIDEFAHEVAEAEKRAREIAAELEEDRRFAPVAEELRDFAENELAPVREKLEAAQFASAAERVDALEKVQPMLREAREKLRAAEAELRARQEKVAAFERMKDLADRQDALAKAAEKIRAERPVDARKLDAWKNLEQAAARLAGDVGRKTDSEQIESARRKMELAAARMQELKDDIALENDPNLKEADRTARRKATAERREQARAAALKQAATEAKRAEEMLAKACERAEIAARTADLNERAQRVRESESAGNQAGEAARRVAAALERAEAAEALQAAEARVLEAIREARAASADRAAALKAAETAQKAVRQALETGEPVKDLAGAAERAAAETRTRRAAALAELEKAERASASALTELRRNKTVEAVRRQAEAAAALEGAREKLAANGLDAAERSMKEARTAGEQAKANPNNEGVLQNAVERQRTALRDLRAAADALAEAQGESLSARRARRRREAWAERLAAAEAAAERADARRLEAEKRNDRGAAERFRREADRATDRADGLRRAQTPDQESAEDSQPETGGDRFTPATAGEAPRDLAEAAAEEIRDAVAAEAKRLGLEVASTEVGTDRSVRSPKGAEKGARTPNDEHLSSGGGVARVMKELEGELKRNNAPLSLLDSISRRAWYRIRGTAKDGLGEGDLKDIPPEYRDLVRRYFLRLTETAW